MEQRWTSTLDARVAAAFGSMGVTIKIDRTLRARTNELRRRYHLTTQSEDGKVFPGLVMKRFQDGALEKEEPGHAFLTILRGFRNAELLLECARKGKRIRLEQVPGTEVWRYVEGGDGLPGITMEDQARQLIKTGDLKMAAGLGIAGLPVLRIDGSDGKYLFWVRAWGPPREGGQPPADGNALMMAWRRDMAELPWELPFAQAMRGQFNLDRVRDAAERARPLVLVEKPRSVKSALVHIDATDKAWDVVKRAFDS